VSLPNHALALPITGLILGAAQRRASDKALAKLGLAAAEPDPCLTTFG
jgi:hypothetical protein